jgi:hypothetical protein
VGFIKNVNIDICFEYYLECSSKLLI